MDKQAKNDHCKDICVVSPLISSIPRLHRREIRRLQQLVAGLKFLYRLSIVIARDELVEGNMHAIANVWYLSNDELLLLPLDVVFLFSVVAYNEFVNVFDKFLLHCRLESFESIR